jgi:hypothetical protein
MTHSSTTVPGRSRQPEVQTSARRPDANHLHALCRGAQALVSAPRECSTSLGMHASPTHPTCRLHAVSIDNRVPTRSSGVIATICPQAAVVQPPSLKLRHGGIRRPQQHVSGEASCLVTSVKCLTSHNATAHLTHGIASQPLLSVGLRALPLDRPGPDTTQQNGVKLLHAQALPVT